MELDITPKDEGQTVKLRGQFTFSDNERFRQLLSMINREAPRFLEIDFADVDFIDSAGLGMLLLLRDACNTQQISMSLHSPRGQVKKIFSISKFDQLFSITE